MKVLKNCMKLSCSVKIYVPSTIEVNKNFDGDEWIEKTLSFLADTFGGSTATKALGAWVSATGELIKERVTLVFSYATTSQLEFMQERLYDFCIEMKNELKQEAIALEVNGELYLI